MLRGPSNAIVNAAEFDNLKVPLEMIGVNLTVAVNEINRFGVTANDSVVGAISPRYAKTLQISVACLYTLLEVCSKTYLI